MTIVWGVLGFLLGGAAGGLFVLLRTRGRDTRDAVREARRISSAEAAAAAEREQRQGLQSEIDGLRATERQAQADAAALRARVEAADRFAADQKAFVESSRKEMEDSFRSLASLALRGNNEEFLKLAQQRLEISRERAGRDLDDRKRGIETLLAPLRETLGKLEVRTGDIEKAREGAYQGLTKQLDGLLRATAGLEEKTTSLTSALRGTRTQGRWGELALRNVVELAGMSERVDFVQQKETPDGKRPDMIVRLPGDRFIAVDSKVSLNAYLESVDATSDEQRNRALDRHVASVRKHVRTLAARDYAESVKGSVDLVVLFLPGDPFLAAAFERNPDLQIEAMRSRVLVATPSTLVALLRTVAIYWQQRAIAENAQRIAEVAQELYDRGAKFASHLDNVGKGLEGAMTAYNDAVGSFERRFLPMSRQLDELGATEHAKTELETPRTLEEAPRALSSRSDEPSEDDDLATLPLFEMPGLQAPGSSGAAGNKRQRPGE